MIEKNDLDHLATKEDIQQVLTVLDGLAGRMDTFITEMGAQTIQMERHESWIKGLATHTQYDLEA